MKFLLILIILLFSQCSKPKTVLICGDHVCINKAEANQYFEEKLSIEVKIINNKNNEEQIDLVELNLKKDQSGNRQISVSSKNKISENLRTLSKEEVSIIKSNIKNKKQNPKITKRLSDKNKIKKKEKLIKEQKIKTTNNNKLNNNVNKKLNNDVDVCTILEKCSIDEISKYLLKQGNFKNYPDITTRQ